MATFEDKALDYRTAVVQVEQALVRRMALAFRERVPPAATRADLRQIDARNLYPYDPCFVEEIGRVAQWIPALREPDDNQKTFAPIEWLAEDGSLQPGRWVISDDMAMYADRETDQAIPLCMKRTGYLRSVELYQGRTDSDALWERFTGRRPLLAIRYAGDTRKLLNPTEAIYRVEMRFQLIGLSHHPRRGEEALEGSDTGEAANDPGLHNILGDADDCALGQSHPESGYAHLVPGVQRVLPGEHQIMQELQSQRVFVGAANITVVCGVHRPDYDVKPFTAIGMKTQSVTGRPADAVDADNAVLRGLGIPWPAVGLVVTPEQGSVRLHGGDIEVNTGSLTLPANSDSYRYVDQFGAVIYQSVAHGERQPETPAGCLLVGRTETDGTGVLYDTYLCTTLFDVDVRDIDTVVEGED